MKVQIILPLSIAVSVAAFALMKVRVKELAAEEKKMKFQDVKLRVTDDVLMEYGKEMKSIEGGMGKEITAQEDLKKILNEQGNEALKAALDSCVGLKKKTTDEIAAKEEEAKTFQAESAKEKADWEAEIAALNEKLNTPSPICNYLKAGSSLKDICPEKKEEPKAAPPKPSEEKKEPPKAEEKKEPPKAEEKEPPKAEEKEPPKAEEKKEPPKAEEKKEPPKAEEKKEPPKAEEKKEPPKAEEAKPDAPKPEEAKPEAPKQ